MNLYKIEITKVPDDSLRYVGRMIVDEYSGDQPEDVYDHNPEWRPDGWEEHVEWVAENEAAPWAIRCREDGYPFFWPSETKTYKSRSSAREKQQAVERWGGKARILVAEVGPWEYVEDVTQRRRNLRDLARADRLREEALAIESHVAVRSI